MLASSSSKVSGTSRDTTSSVTAKPKTASAKPSIRNTSWPRQEKPSSPPIRLCAKLLRSTSTHHSASHLLFSGGLNDIHSDCCCHRVLIKLLTFFTCFPTANFTTIGPAHG